MAPWRSEGGSCAAYLWNLSHLESILDPPSVCFNPPLRGNIRLNYQDPDDGVLYSSGYGVRGIYIYIYRYNFLFKQEGYLIYN